MSDKISWKYPLLGVTEHISEKVEYELKSKCGEQFEGELEFPLPGVTNINPSERYILDMEIKNKDIDDVIRKWVRIEPIIDKLDHPEQRLRYKLRFKPMKPFKCLGVFTIRKPNHGGHWKFKSKFKSLYPEPQRTIQIPAKLGDTEVTVINIDMPEGSHHTEFTAEFTYDSASEFSVSPTSGRLRKTENQIIVSYQPGGYGKVKQAKLEIQTKDYFWSFLIVGTFPKLVIKETRSTIVNSLDKDTLKKINRSRRKRKRGQPFLQ